MEDTQYHLSFLFKYIKKNLHLLPEEDQKFIQDAANAVHRSVQNDVKKKKIYANMVQEMRKAQNNYFKFSSAKLYTVSSEWLSKSKMLESAVDKKTIEIIRGVIQPDLFH